jgi:predicted transcriptional regulator
VRELESQGLGKKVIADMFGLALRSYRQKVQRIGESATTRGVTLWSAVHSYLSERPAASRNDILLHFKHDEESSVRGILNDLVESGLVHRSGRGKDTKYRVATAEELEELGASAAVNSLETNAALVWVHVYRASPIRRDQLAELLPLPSSALDQALQHLTTEGRIRVETRGDQLVYATDHCLIPVGETAGWEAAIIDHHRAVLNAVAAKVVSGARRSTATDEVGGTTLSFDLWPGHPREAEVRRLLANVRQQSIRLWEEVTEYNGETLREDAYTVTFYCGQYVVENEEE